jgi:hypothetical protein
VVALVFSRDSSHYFSFTIASLKGLYIFMVKAAMNVIVFFEVIIEEGSSMFAE